MERKKIALKTFDIFELKQKNKKITIKNILSFILFLNIVFFGYINEINASTVNTDSFINTNGIVIDNDEFRNLINLGFTRSEIMNMTNKEYNENKNLVGVVVSTNDKYYRVTTKYDNNGDIISTYFEEISESIYNNVNESIFNSISFHSVDGYSETNYKKMKSQIISLAYGYRYKMSVEWKHIPSTRSYDIIGIGIDTSVYITSDITFQQNYCYRSGSCSSSNVSFVNRTATGGSALFKLPTSSSITSMDSYIYFTIGKSSTSTTLNTLYAYGDYSHAVKTTSSSNSSYYSINKNGLILGSSIIESYDEVPITKATWTGLW